MGDLTYAEFAVVLAKLFGFALLICAPTLLLGLYDSSRAKRNGGNGG